MENNTLRIVTGNQSGWDRNVREAYKQRFLFVLTSLTEVPKTASRLTMDFDRDTIIYEDRQGEEQGKIVHILRNAGIKLQRKQLLSLLQYQEIRPEDDISQIIERYLNSGLTPEDFSDDK